VGKWKQVSGKVFCTFEAVKKSHNYLLEVMDVPKVERLDEFKADDNLTETITFRTIELSSKTVSSCIETVRYRKKMLMQLAD